LEATLAGLAGGSGGARPKVHVGFDGRGNISVGEGEIAPGHAAWLVKFRAPEDPIDIGPIEQAYATMATAAGLHMMEHRLIDAKTGPGYFATRRFDGPEGCGRLYVVSLGVSNGLAAKLIATIIDEVRAAFADWPGFAARAGVTPASARTIAEAHDRVWGDFER
jgi:hypothetical protein